MQRSNIAMPLLCRRPWTDPFAIKWVQLDGIVLPFWKLGKDAFCIAELQVLNETLKENKCEDEHQ